MEIEKKIEELATIYRSYEMLCAKRGEDVSEEDTRANIIDQIIHKILEWPNETVYRETYANNGYLDYELTTGRPTLVVEAKRSGKAFVFPFKKQPPKVYKISGVLSTNKVAKEAIEQTQKYCVEKGIPFGLTTNGYTWILFKAMVEGMSWRDGMAHVFHSPKDITARLVEFWDLLSYPAVSEGKLKEHFTIKRNSPRAFHRPIDEIIDADAEYGRNSLERELLPFIEKFFGDIVTQDKIQLLEHCYVHSKPIQIIDEGIKIVIEEGVK